jgi:hypothetical protein
MLSVNTASRSSLYRLHAAHKHDGRYCPQCSGSKSLGRSFRSATATDYQLQNASAPEAKWRADEDCTEPSNSAAACGEHRNREQHGENNGDKVGTFRAGECSGLSSI